MHSENLQILHVSSVHPQRDNRIHYKECLSLKAAGYQLALMCGKQERTLDGLRYIAFPEFKTRKERFLKGNLWAFKTCRSLKPALVHFHDPELIPFGLAIRFFGVKVIYDVHEDLSQQLLYKEWLPKMMRKTLSRLVRWLESFSAFFFEAIVAATDDIAANFNSKKTNCLRNLPLLKLLPKPEQSDSKSSAFKLIYAGGLTEVRGIYEIIEALEGLPSNIELNLIGKWESDEYQRKCESLKSFERVNYLGYKSMEEVYAEIAKADLGLAMLYPLKNYLRSMPVKAFEYMLAGKAIIMSDFPFWKEQFAEVALFANPYNVNDIRTQVLRYYENDELRVKMAQAGRKKVENELNWELESQHLLRLYEKLLS